MKSLSIVFLFIVLSKGYSQERATYFELGGASPMISMNFEGVLDHAYLMNYRVGVGYATGWDQFLTFPLGLTKFIKTKGNDYFEIGAVYTVGLNLTERETSGIFFGNFGFRFYNKKDTTFFRLVFNPAINFGESPSIFPWGGISVGFKL